MDVKYLNRPKGDSALNNGVHCLLARRQFGFLIDHLGFDVGVDQQPLPC